MKKNFVHISLRAKIGLTITAILCLGGASTAYLVHANSTGALKTAIGSSLATVADQTMDKLDRFLYERMNDVEALAGRQQLQSFLLLSPSARKPAITAALAKQLQDYERASGTWSALTILDNHGAPLLPTADSQQLAVGLAKQPSVLKLYTAAAVGQAGYSDALSVAPGHDPVMLFMAPVRNEQLASRPVIGVLAGEVSWSSSIVELLSSLKTTQATLVNASGISLGANDSDANHEVLQQDFAGTKLFQAMRHHPDGSGVYPGLDNAKQQFLTAYVAEKGYRTYHGNHWTLILETPTSVAFAPAERVTNNLVLTFLTILAASIAVLMLGMEQQVVRPLRLLKDAAAKVADGDLSKSVPIRSHDELGQLTAVFNAMIAKLQTARRDLHTRAEQAESEERLLRTLLQSLPVGVMVVRASDRQPILINKLGEKLSGRRMELTNGSQPPGYIAIKEDGTPYPSSQSPVALALRHKRAVTKDDILVRRPDGGTLALRATAAPIKEPNGHIEQAVSVFEDITEERELERSRDEFFNIASHELRTPLTAIRGNSEMIQKMYHDKLDEPELAGMVEDIHEASTRLIDIVNDFLDTARLEQKRMTFELEPFDVTANAQSVIKEYQVTGSRQKTHLEVVVPDKPLPLVLADPNRVKQVIINLVGNALKFTEKGSVSISFELEPHFVKVLVTDTGRGMPPAAQKVLFKKFGQAGGNKIAVNSARSTGLGLYICKLIVEQLHGRIKLEWSVTGKGTQFSFTLPLAPDTSDK
ncbi:MAG TPA: ATP-binding protein [Candidatus Saccharimonadales bacterium]|nr:ATP-binding protein [Candidatus Saccharimonadales bacterium]